MRIRLAALFIVVGFATCRASVAAAPTNDPLLKYFSGLWACKITRSSYAKNIGVRFSYSGIRHGKSLVWTYDDGSSGSEVYDPRIKKYLWLGAGDDGSYDTSTSPGWIGNESRWQIILASSPPPLGSYIVTRTSDTKYTEAYLLRGVTKSEWICTKSN